MPTFHKILVPTDFSPCADAAVEYAADLAATYRASVVLIHAYANPVVAIPDGFVVMTAPDFTNLLGQLQAGLRRAEVRIRERGVAEVETRLVEGSAWHEIVETARTQGCDLIVMGTHGRGAIAHFLLGSVAEKVLRKAPCPVLTVRGPR
jgi:nucleotide-binding universal stress UspA family protein